MVSMSVRVALASISIEVIMSKLYKLRRDIKRNPSKYINASWNNHIKGAYFIYKDEIITDTWSRSYKKFITKVLKEIQ